jgi:hypothetical protein
MLAGHGQVDLREIGSNLAAGQFGMRAILVANQIESGVHFPRGEYGKKSKHAAHSQFISVPGRQSMKKLILLPVMFLLFSSNLTVAGKKPLRPFFLKDVVVLNGAQVPAGVYELTWESRGAAARVTLSKDGKFVATAQGVWVKGGEKYKEDAVLLRVNSDGTKSLIEIRIAGGARSIVFEGTDAPVHYTSLRR